jgi:ABC-type polar amino acid transport system ATPase subunit
MSFLKKLFKSNKQNKPIRKNTEIALNSAFSINENSLRAYVILGTQGYGKSTLTLRLINELAKNYGKVYLITSKKPEEFQHLDFKDKIETISDLSTLKGAENCIIAIDDLKSNIAHETLSTITDIMRIARHKNITVIITHHLLNQIPTQILQLSEKTIFFNTRFNPSQNSKLLNIISKNKLQRLHDLVLSLEPYNYVIVQNNKVYGIFNNTDITPIINKKPSKEISLNGSKTENQQITEQPQDILTIVKAMIPEFYQLTLTQQIIALNKAFPKLKPKAIAKVLNTTPQTVRTKLYQARNGLIKA